MTCVPRVRVYQSEYSMTATQREDTMTDKNIGYDPDVLMAACIQAAATVMAAKNPEAATDPVEIARLAAEIRDEALVQM